MLTTAKLHMITQTLDFAITELSSYITERKNENNFHLSQSLNNPATSAKCKDILDYSENLFQL